MGQYVRWGAPLLEEAWWDLESDCMGSVRSLSEGSPHQQLTPCLHDPVAYTYLNCCPCLSWR